MVMQARSRERVVVVGAGPAGAYLGYLLARASADVVVVHRPRPAEKPCGGGVTGRALEDVPELQGIEGGRAIERVVFRAPSGREVLLDGAELLRIYPRRRLDEAVRELALRAGARFVKGAVETVTREPDGYRLRGEHIDLFAPFLVGADGVKSRVRSALIGPLDPRETFLACGFWVEGDPGATAVLRFERGLRGYLWVFPRLGSASVGACALGRDCTPAALFERAAALAEEVLPGAARRPYASRIPAPSFRSLGRLRFAGERFVLVGDASGLVDPITGEGIRYGFQTARLAAEAILAGDGASGYATSIAREVLPVLASGARWRGVFYAPAFLESMVSLCARRAGARKLLFDLMTGQQAYRGLFARLVREGVGAARRRLEPTTAAR